MTRWSGRAALAPALPAFPEDQGLAVRMAHGSGPWSSGCLRLRKEDCALHHNKSVIDND
jgi:hypothetical protein